MDVTGKTAVITGAAGGIGLGIARACLDEGMQIVISDVDEERLAATVTELNAAGAAAVGHPCDVRDASRVVELRDAALSAYGRVDLLCNNAGLGLTRPVLEATDSDWDLLFDVNVRGVVNGIRTFLPLFVEQGEGHINSTGSLSGLVADPDLVIYDGTKFAVVGMMEALAIEMFRDHPGVTCSVLCPGPVATNLIGTSSIQLVEAGADDPANHERTAMVAEYLAAGMHPDAVGQITIQGIKAGKFWLITHPEDTFDLMQTRFEAMKMGQLDIPKDWATE